MIIYCDGGSRGNPGPAASAFVATDGNTVVFKGSKYLGLETNNIAEYNAVLLALNWLSTQEIKDEVVINLDSQLIERQINGFYKVKNIKLKELHTKVLDLLKVSKNKIKFIWNYRTDNKQADALVNETLDMQASTGK